MIDGNRKIMNFLIMFWALISGVPAFSQTVTPIAHKDNTWSLYYRVSVTGEFSKEPEVGTEGPIEYYHLKRVYEGRSRLTFEPAAKGKKPAAQANILFKDPSTKVHITIDDFKHTIYDPICGDYNSVEENWKANVESWMGDNHYPALLLVNNEKPSYKTSFPILYIPRLNGSEIEYTRKEIENLRTGQKKVKDFPPKWISFHQHKFPAVKGFIENASIIRTPDWSELKKEGDTFSWVSDILHPDEPLIEGVPDSKDKVNIIIYYFFKLEN